MLSAMDYNEEAIKKDRLEALRYGLKRKLSLEDSEDLAQRFIIARHIRKSNQLIEYAYIDFIRDKRGDLRRKCDIYRKDPSLLANSLIEPQKQEDPLEVYERRSTCLKNLKQLTARERRVIRLLLKKRSRKGVAEVLGVTPDRISQIIIAIKFKIIGPGGLRDLVNKDPIPGK